MCISWFLFWKAFNSTNLKIFPYFQFWAISLTLIQPGHSAWFIPRVVIKSHNFNVVTHIATHNMSQNSWKLKPYILHICYNKHLHDLYYDYYDLENSYYWYFYVSILSYIVSLLLNFVSHWCAQISFRAKNTSNYDVELLWLSKEVLHDIVAIIHFDLSPKNRRKTTLNYHYQIPLIDSKIQFWDLVTKTRAFPRILNLNRPFTTCLLSLKN